MKSVRDYAKQIDFEIVGKLTRCYTGEYKLDRETGKKKYYGIKCFVDEANNTYDLAEDGLTISTADGAVITIV